MKRAILIFPLALIAYLLLPQGCLLLERAFGPDAMELNEFYAKQAAGESFDHSRLDRVLRASVKELGTVDYESLRTDPSDLDGYIQSLAAADFEALSRDEKLALLINAYNACTLRLILDHWPLQSIRDIPSAERWEDERWMIGGVELSLHALENDFLRARFREPRIHFAINCASIGCPPLRGEAYRGATIESQLQEQAMVMHGDPRWFELEREAGQVYLSRIYLWYEGDFAQLSGDSLQFAARFSPELDRILAKDHSLTIEWLPYDWALNSK